MRATLIIACAGLLLAAGAHAQEALKLCRQVKDDGERLKCYDGIDVSASNPAAPPADSKQAGAPWLITDEKSPLDDFDFF